MNAFLAASLLLDRRHPRILLLPRMSTFFACWNVLFPWLDFVYTTVFLPGVVLALFGIYWVAGPMTLALLPMALLMNLVMYRISMRMFATQGLRVRRNVAGFLMYAFGYSLILQPVSMEQQVGAGFTAIGLAGSQRFTDGNKRVHLRGRLIWVLVPSQGLSAQLRWRQYRSSELDAGGAYFNPRRYREWQAGLAIRKRYAGWLWSGTLAAGREEIDGGVQQTTKLADVRIEGPIGKRARLALHASYNRAANFGTADDDWYRSVGVTLTVPF